MPKIMMLMLVLGIGLGIFVYTFYYGKGISYLIDKSDVCLNCHVMQDVWNRWNHSSHKEVANCNDCHTPKNFIGKWFTKSINGYRHAMAFTTNSFKEVIHITDFNANIVQQRCINCHRVLVNEIHITQNGKDIRCIRCHSNVGH